MQKQIYKATDRGQADYGWLKPSYYFSFSNYYRPDRVRFGALRVLNDDFIAGGGEFPLHPHDNMEIVTIPLSGALKHSDNTGGKGVITSSEVQIMSAGAGIQHSEANASATEPVTLFQIWILPKQLNITPRYSQQQFSQTDRINRWQILVSPDATDKALWINQDARIAQATLAAGNTLTWQNKFDGNGIFLIVVEGNAAAASELLDKRDALALTGTNTLEIAAKTDCRLLLLEVPM
jgi:quercetin 2,3-dioxygenase